MAVAIEYLFGEVSCNTLAAYPCCLIGAPGQSRIPQREIYPLQNSTTRIRIRIVIRIKNKNKYKKNSKKEKFDSVLRIKCKGEE